MRRRWELDFFKKASSLHTSQNFIIIGLNMSVKEFNRKFHGSLSIAPIEQSLLWKIENSNGTECGILDTKSDRELIETVDSTNKYNFTQSFLHEYIVEEGLFSIDLSGEGMEP